MWIFLSNAFMSIVEDRQVRGNLLVRARYPNHIKNVFPKAKVSKSLDRDYAFRTSLPRETVSQVIADRVMSIDYSNFKDTVKGEYHNNCSHVWWTMYQAQERQLQNNRRNRHNKKNNNSKFDGFSFLLPDETYAGE